MSRSLFAAFCSIVLCSVAFGQKIPVTEKPGKVSVEECSMKTFEADSTAEALVLWENCDIVVDYNPVTGEIRYMKDYLERIKILKEDGLGYADGVIYISKSNDAREILGKLTVTTYNLENGKVVASKAPKSSIIRSDYNDNAQKVTYAADKVKVGSVVELSYQISSLQYFNIPDYYMQRSIPVNSSHYSVSLPAWLTATKNVRGLHQIEVSSSRENGQDLEGFVYDNTHYVDTYRAVDLPAMKREPMLYCSRQFLDAVSYEITAMNVPGHFINFSRSWKDVAEAVHNSKVYEVMHAPSQFKSDVSAIRSKDADDLTKLSEIVALVRKNVQWDNKIDLIPSGQSSVIKDHSGTSSDINALIGSAAIAAGYKVSPVLIRLRTSGPIMGPSLSAFDTFILHITAADGKDYFLDGADPSGYFNVLPELYLVDRGFEISDTKGEFNWVNLTSLLKNSTSYLVMAAVSPDGNLSGTLNGKFSNVSSLDFKDAFRGLKDEEELYEKMGKTVLADLSELKVTGLDEFTSQSNLSVKFEKACDVAGNLLVVNPFIVPLLSDAAFKGEDRKLPVEFPYPESTSYIFRVSIPEGYVVDQLPSNGRLSSQLPANMTIMSMSDGTAVTVQFKFDNKALISMPNAYSEVRKFWTDVCAVFDGRIIFKKAE